MGYWPCRPGRSTLGLIRKAWLSCGLVSSAHMCVLSRDTVHQPACTAGLLDLSFACPQRVMPSAATEGIGPLKSHPAQRISLMLADSNAPRTGARLNRARKGASDETAAESISINRALPPWAMSALRTGIECRKPDLRKVWGLFVAIAMSCQRRGWTQVQYVEEMWSRETRLFARGERVFGHWPLMIQLLTGVKGNSKRAQRQIDRAWATASENLKREGTLKPIDEYMTDLIGAAYAWEDRLDDDVDNLSDTQKQVMRYVITSVQKRRNSKVTCPCREVGAIVGIPHSSASNTLKELAKRGFLVLHDSGSYSENPKNRKAAIYSLSDPFELAYGGRP